MPFQKSQEDHVAKVECPRLSSVAEEVRQVGMGWEEELQEASKQFRGYWLLL